MIPLSFYDAAYPPANPPVTDGVVIYCGGGDVLHAWTGAEIRAQTARYRLPVFVRSNPAQANPRADAQVFLSDLRAMGCPAGSVVVLDVETAVDSAYVQAFWQEIYHVGGYVLMVYGSQSTVFGDKPPTGLIFGADWTGKPHLANGD